MARGQVSIFVIVGFVLIIVLALLYTALSDINNSARQSQKQGMISYDYAHGLFSSHIIDCLQSSLEAAVFTVSSRAGFISATPMPELDEQGTSSYIIVGEELVPVALDKSGSYFLETLEVEKRICRLSFRGLEACIDAQAFEVQGFTVALPYAPATLGFIDENCRAVVKDESVLIYLNYSASLAKGDYRINTSRFSAESHLPLGMLLSSGKALADYALGRQLGSCIISEIVVLQWVNSEVFRLTATGDVYRPGFFFQAAIKGFDLQGSCPSIV